MIRKLRAVHSPAGQLHVLKFHPALQIPGDVISLQRDRPPLLNPFVLLGCGKEELVEALKGHSFA